MLPFRETPLFPEYRPAPVFWHFFSGTPCRTERYAAVIQRAYRMHLRKKHLLKKLAFAMGLHARLGEKSVVAMLESDVVAFLFTEINGKSASGSEVLTVMAGAAHLHGQT